MRERERGGKNERERRVKKKREGEKERVRERVKKREREWKNERERKRERRRAQFHQRSTYSFYARRSQKRNGRTYTDVLTVFFTLLGSTSAKAVRRMLMKLTPGRGAWLSSMTILRVARG